ncbi:FAD-dependent monooxygenase [Kribbella sp. NPDC004536]|uniref:FAD-dependent monooxygenase n=1 Tax=Kribbella sp. NPDC004536 TaxID=3364106 RepID=UPI0036ACEB57
MRLRTVAVLGGGPGGLYTARLLRLRMPDCEVRLIEQTEPRQTFGFGVGLATRTQRNLQAADPESFEGILGIAHSHEMTMTVDGHAVTLPSDDLIAVSRGTLLDVLREHAAGAGVRLEYGDHGYATELAKEVDLVIAADGVSSATREELGVFGSSVTTADGLYLWAGTDVALPSALFTPATTEHGTFVAHAYPYAADRSTFLVETDEETWRRAGFDVTTEQTPYDCDDQVALDYLSDAFAEQLPGHRLIGNRTRWLRFRTVSCERWHDRNVVLLGDAVHTAHYSIGSGTKLAMEDGIALVEALAGASDLETALTDYEAQRRPAVEHLQSTALRSMRWWDTFPTRLDLPVERLWVAYMTRAGKVTLDRFGSTAPDVVRTAINQYASTAAPQPAATAGPLPEASGVPVGGFSDWVLAHQSPFVDGLAEVFVDVGDPRGADADVLIKGLDATAVLLTSGDDREAVLTMLDVAERIRLETATRVEVRIPTAERDLGAAALVSGRADAVRLRGEAR